MPWCNLLHGRRWGCGLDSALSFSHIPRIFQTMLVLNVKFWRWRYFKSEIHSCCRMNEWKSCVTILFLGGQILQSSSMLIHSSERSSWFDGKSLKILKANCQVNRLHCCSFVCLAMAAASFANTWVWTSRAALAVPFLLTAAQAFRPDSLENVAIRLWEDRVGQQLQSTSSRHHHHATLSNLS